MKAKEEVKRGVDYFSTGQGKLAKQISSKGADITEKKKAEKEIREQKEFYEQILDLLPSLYFLIDNKGKLLKWNNNTVAVSGYTNKEIAKIKAVDLIANEDKKEVIRALARAFKKGRASVEANLLTKDGKKRLFYFTGNRIRLKEEYYVTGFGIDISERKRAEEAIRLETAKLSSAMRAANLGDWEYDVLKNEFTFTDEFYNIFHTTAKKVGGYKMTPAEYARRFVHPDDAYMVGVETKKALETKDPHYTQQLDHRIKYTDGKEGYISVRIFIVKDDKGRTIKTYGVNQDITKRKKAEEALKESEKKYRNLVENASDQIFMVDNKYRMLSINKVALALLRKKPNEVIGKSVSKIFPKEIAAHSIRNLYKVFKTGKGLSVEEKLVLGGSEFWSSTALNPVKDDNGKITGVQGVVRDITERKRAEEKIKESENRYRSYIELTKQLAWTTDGRGLVTEDIPAWRAFTGQSIKQVNGLGWLKAIHPDDAERTARIWKKAVKEKSVYEAQYRVLGKDGRYRWFFARGIPILGKDGRIQEWVGTCIDVTEKKEIEEKIRESERKYRILVENIPQKIFFKDRNSVYVSCNKNYAKDLKIKADEIIGKTDFEFFAKGLAEQYRADDKRIMGGNKVEEIEEKYVKDGKEFWVHTIKVPVKGEKGEVIGILGIFWDITRKKEMEIEIEKSEEKYKEISRQWSSTFDSMADGISIHGVDYRIMNVNAALARMLGAKKEEIIGKKCHEIFHDKKNPILECPMKESLNTQKEKSVEIYEPKLKAWLHVSTSPIVDEKGNIMEVIHIVRDITHPKQEHEELQQRVDELEHFHKLTIGRELRMVELKRKIKELENKLKR
jgi:PAS domain S-box-containing protein